MFKYPNLSLKDERVSAEMLPESLDKSFRIVR